MLKNKKKGFTLIELIVVMAILAILVALGAPRFIGYTKDSQVTAQAADAKIIEQAAYQYAIDNDDNWPVGAPLTDLDDNTKAVIANVLKDELELTDEAAATMVEAMLERGYFCEIDETEVSKFIRSTKNDISEYFIVNKAPAQGSETVDDAGILEGVVFKKVAQEDSKGNFHSGIYDNK
jgi:prepilin-type N-terminal cleavage/methylation domain-containing protein